MTSQFADMTSSSNFFDIAMFLLSILVTGPGCVNNITGSGVMTIFIHKGLTKNPEIRNIPNPD